MEESHKPKIYVIVSIREQISKYLCISKNITDPIIIWILFSTIKRHFYNWTWTYRSDSEIVQTMGPITQQLGEPKPLGTYLVHTY